MYEISDSEVVIHLCTFEAYFYKAKVNLRFPSLFFVEWKSMNSKNSVAMIGRKRAINSNIDLDETLLFTTEMIFHRGQDQYLKKESLIHLNLISSSRPDEVKLVGRVVIDLSNIANSKILEELSTFKLMYCSVDADITFKVKMSRCIQSNLHLKELDKSAFSDLYSFTGPKNGLKLEFKDTASEKRKPKYRSIQKEETPSRNGKTHQSGKTDNILIKDHHQEESQDNNMLNSLPLTEKKKGLPPIESTPQFKRTESNQVSVSVPVKYVKQQKPESRQIKPDIDLKIDPQFYKERDLLERELSQHKNRIKKLQTDIKSAMKMFQQSESQSQLAKTKLVQSENALQSLAARENKIKEEHSQEISKVRESYEKEIEIVKSGYEADIKILRATLEQEKLKQDEQKSREQHYIQELQILSKKLHEDEALIADLSPLKIEIDSLNEQISLLNKQIARILQEKQVVDTQLTQKIEQIQANLKQNQIWKREIELIQAQKQQANQAIIELQQQLSLLQSQLNEERASKVELNRALDELATTYEDKISKLKEQITNYQIKIQRTFEQGSKTIEKSTPLIPGNSIPIDINPFKASTPQQQSKQSEALLDLQQKIVQLEKIREAQAIQIAQYEQNIASIRLECDIKIQSLLKQLENYQNENHKLVNLSSKHLAQGSSKELAPLDEETLTLNQRLHQQNQKINEELEVMKQNQFEEKDTMSKLCQQHKQIKEDNFVLEERIKLQQIQIDELKQEKETIRQRMQKMLEQFEYLKKKGEAIKLQRSTEEQRKANEQQSLEQAKEQLKVPQNGQTLNVKEFDQVQIVNKRIAQDIKNIDRDNQEQAVKIIQSPEQQLKIQPCPHVQLSPKTIDERLNSSAENVHERHNYAFEQHLTHQDINSFAHAHHNQVQEQQAALREQNQRLREDLEELKGQLQAKEAERMRVEEERHEVKVQSEQVIAHLENEKVSLTATINNLQQEINPLIRSQKNVSFLQSKPENTISSLPQANDQPDAQEPTSNSHRPSHQLPKRQQQLKRCNQIILEQQEAYSRLEARVHELEQQVSAVNEQSLLPSERQRLWMKDLESKVESLEEEMKIKDQLLSENERNLMENYQIKFELADLKDKYNEIKQALDQRDAYISELEETKEFLSKQMEKMQQQIGERDTSHKAIEFKMEKVVELTDNHLNQGHSEKNQQNHQLKEEIEALGAQLIKLNNQNTELRTLLGDTRNDLNNTILQAKNRQTQLIQVNNQLKSEVLSLSNSLTQLQKRNENEELITIVDQKLPLKNGDDRPIVASLKETDQSQRQNVQRITTLQQELSSLKTRISELMAEVEALTINNCEIQNSNKEKEKTIDQLKLTITQLQGLMIKKEEQNHIIQVELQETALKVAQLHQEPINDKESPTSEKNNKSLSHLVQGMPFLEVHTIESHSEAPPLNYSQDNITFDEFNQKDHLSSNQIQALNQQIASLKFDLSQEQEQKVIYQNSIQQYKAKIEDLNQQIKHLKEQQQKFSGLPLQSFDSNQRFANNLREIITEESKEHEPSILRQILVGSQPRESAHIPNMDSPNPKQKLQTQTRLETNLASLTSEQLQSIKREMQMVKEQLESQRKIHYQLQQIHKICKKKYELLETRYQNCIEQLEFYQIQNQSLTRNKAKTEQELYRLKRVIEEVQKEQQQQCKESTTKKVQQKKDQNIEVSKNEVMGIEDTFSQDMIFNRAATALCGTSSIPQREVNQISETVQPNKQIQEYQQQIQALTKDRQFFKTKTLILQENIQSLQQALQQQIELQQTNEKLLLKLQALNELQAMAGQFQLEKEQLQKENEELKKVKAEYQSLVAQRTDLNKMLQEHKQWQSQRKLWENKLSQIEEMILLKETQYNGQKAQLEQRISALQQQKIALTSKQIVQGQTGPNQTTEILQSKASEQYLAREQQYIEQLASTRAEKLEQLEKVANLEEKINTIEFTHQQKLLQLEESLTIRQNQLEELRFAFEQLQRELQQHKAALEEIQVKRQNMDHYAENYDLLQENYRLTTEELNNVRDELEHYVQRVKELEEAGLKLQRQIQQHHQEKGATQEPAQLKDQIRNLQIQIASKSANIEQLELKSKQLQQSLNSLALQLEEHIITIHAKEQEIEQISTDRVQFRTQNEQLVIKLQQIQQNLNEINEKFATAQTRTSTLTAQAQSKAEQIRNLQEELSLKTVQLSSLHLSLSSKEQNLIKISKQLNNQKLMTQRSQQKIKMLSEKEKQIKETLILVEAESRKIVEALKERYKSQEAYYNKYLEKEKECTILLTTAAQITEEIASKDRLLEHEKLKTDKLQGEIDLLKKQNEGGLPPTDSQGFAVEYSKYQKLMATNDQLMLKNRQYLQKLSEKSTINSENERLKSELKSISAALSHINSEYSHFKSQHESNHAVLLGKLKSTEQKNEKQSQKLSQLQQELNAKKQKDMEYTHALYDSLIAQKNQEIEALRKQIQERKRREIDDHPKIQQQQAQIAHVLQQKSSNKVKESTGVQTLRNITAELHGVCRQIKDISEQRKGNEQSLYQAFIQKYDQIEDHFSSLNAETALIQEKARLISKQLQKIKAHIVKSQTKALKEKTQLLSLIKPCESAAGELVALSETLSERDSQSFL